jgi:parallel beta-helix repeat protein
MIKKIFSGIASIVLLIGMLSSAFYIQTGKAVTIIVPDNYDTIQEAINHALDGDTVFVRARTYYEDIVVNKSISLIGENRDTTFIFGGNTTYVVLVTSDNATVVGFTVRNGGPAEDRYGIGLMNVEGCNISMNSLTPEDLVGILLTTSSHNKIIGNTFTGSGLAVVANSFKNTVVNNTVGGKPIIYLEGETNQIVYGSYAGQVIFVNCTGCAVENGRFGNTSIGVQIRNSKYCNVSYCSFDHCFEGISTGRCSGNRISRNNITNTIYGLVNYGVNSSILDGNYVGNNGQHGIYFLNSRNSSIVGNMLAQNNNTGIYLDHAWSSYVSGNYIIDGYNGVYIWFSSNITLTQNKLTGVWYGVQMTYLSNNVISENNITETDMAIILDHTDANSIYGNNMTNNGLGVRLLQFSSNNTISGNSIRSLVTLNGVGLYFGTLSNNNLVVENDIEANTYAFQFWNCSNNRIYHNNVINNTHQVYIYFNTSTNIWDNGYPSGGNYWSDYNSTDVYRGVFQNETGSDGIGDTPNIIDPQNIDNYPLMGPFGPSTKAGENVTVFPTNAVGLIFENVATGGSTTVDKTATGPAPFSGYKIEGQYFSIQTTASYSGNITIRITYDDTHMTQQEEESLQLMHWNETTQQWENITTHVDIENNVIYGETNHLSVFAVHSVLIHDLSIFSVHAFKTIIGKGYALDIDVDVWNEGDFEETFDATIDLVAGQISYLSIFSVHIVSGNTMTLHFTWDTTNNAIDTYNIIAHVSHVAYEVNTADNDCTDGEVKVTIPGDVDGDFFVNIMDATQIGYYWLQGVPPAPPEVDITGDGIINILDATIVGLNWLQHA